MPTIGVRIETLINLNEQKRRFGGRLESHDEVITRLLEAHNKTEEAGMKARMRGDEP